MSRCPFCKRDPYHYVDNGIGIEAVGIECCDLGIGLYYNSKESWQTLRDMRSFKPHAKARAWKVLVEHGHRGRRR